MESGEFSRGKESIRAEGCMALVGNFEVDVEHQQRVGHLFGRADHDRSDAANADKTIVVILPDAGERYLSGALFEGLFEEVEKMQAVA